MQVTLVCTLGATIDLPEGLKNEEEIREYLRCAYEPKEILKRADIEDFTIEEIEGCPQERDDYDEFDDRWHSGELQ